VVRRQTVFIPKPYEFKLYLLQELLAASQTGNAIGFRQLLRATSFDTVELEIAIVQSVSECQSHMSEIQSMFLDCPPD